MLNNKCTFNNGAYNRDAVYVKNKTRKRKLKNYKV